MNKYKNNKKGFTIVELVIVIAVIAILSAVLIPTFSGLIKKANVTADQTLVRNLNTSLAIASDGSNGKSTMYETLNDLKDQGYDITKLSPTSAGSDIVWDSNKNQFVLVMQNGEYYTGTTYEDYKESDYYKLWKIYTNTDVSNSKYSVYLSNTDLTGEVTVNGVGFDAGENTGISKVTYNSDNDRANTIRTNGGELVVNAPDGTVNHYEKADKVTVIAVAGHSYHEYGKVEGTITIQAGHISVEKTAEVSSIVADVKSSENTSTEPAKITATNGSKVGTVVVKDSTASVNVESGATVEEVAPAAGVTIDSSKVTGIEPSKTEIDVSKTDKFSSGLGTKASPYIISGTDGWISFRNSGETIKGKYFKVVTDLDFTNVTAKIDINSFVGSIDFDNHTVSGLNNLSKHAYQFSSCYGYLFDYVDGNSTIKNLTFEMRDLGTDKSIRLVYYVGYRQTNSSLSIENVSTYGKVTYSDNNTSSFVSWLYPGSALSFVDCVNGVNITNNSMTGAFLGKVYEHDSVSEEVISNTKLEFVRCVNNATIQTTVGNAAMLISNPCGNKFIKTENIKIVDCINKGNIIAGGTDGKTNLVISNGSLDTSFTTQNIRNEGVMTTAVVKNITVKKNSNFDFSNIVDASSYRLTYSGFAKSKDSHGILSQVFDFNSKDVEIKAYEFANYEDVKSIQTNTGFGTTYLTTVINGVTYYVLDGGFTFTSTPNISLCAYDANGNVTAIYSFTLVD